MFLNILVEANNMSIDNVKEINVIKSPHKTCFFSMPEAFFTGILSPDISLYLSKSLKYFFSEFF